MPTSSQPGPTARKSRLYPFRRAVLSGLGIVLPPLLTIVIFLWVGSTIQQYVLEPVTSGARNVLAWYLGRQDLADPQGEPIDQNSEGRTQIRAADGQFYVELPKGGYVPTKVYEAVRPADPHGVLASGNRSDVYRRYVQIEYLQPELVIPVFLCVFVVVLYLLGKFLAAGIGRVSWNLFERGIHRLPLVRNVYGSVKQVTDFMFNKGELEYTRVVAVEYPRKGIWSIGFVTGESLLDIRSAANEPVLSVMVPCSPMSMTGYTITVLKSETIDLNLTVDQAFQYIISCGVVVPPHQIHDARARARAEVVSK